MTIEEFRISQLEELMKIDPDTREVIASMRSRGRSWNRIFLCFASQMVQRGMNVNVSSEV